MRVAKPRAPVSYGDLRSLLQARLESLPEGQQRIARLVLSDPEGCAFRTISETARACDVHESSVVRFAAALGLEGYPGLVELCRQELSDQAQLVRRFEEARQHEMSSQLLKAVAQSDERNLERTYARIDEASWDRVVSLLAKASAVHIIGLRKCFSVAYLFTYLLHLVRRNVHQITATSGLLIDELRDMNTGEVFVAISIHRYTSDTVRALAHARKLGLATVVLTDNAASPLASYADEVFYVETTGVTILRSLTAFASVVQALATAVAIKLGTKSRSELLLDEELHETFQVFAEGADLPSPRRGNRPRAKPRSTRQASSAGVAHSRQPKAARRR